MCSKVGKHDNCWLSCIRSNWLENYFSVIPSHKIWQGTESAPLQLLLRHSTLALLMLIHSSYTCTQKKEAAKLANKGKPKAKKGKAPTGQSPEATTSTSAESATAAPSSSSADSTADASVEPDAQKSANEESTTHVDTPPAIPLPQAHVQEVAQHRTNKSDSDLKQPTSSTAELSSSIPADHHAEPAEDAGVFRLEGAASSAVLPDRAVPPDPAHGPLHAEPAGDALPTEPHDSAVPAEPAGNAESAEPAGHALPAAPKDVMEEMESLGMLPDMPKVDYKDDLPGLFQAAFATCDTQMSPRRAAREMPQPVGAEELSLYEDADEALEEEDREGKGSEGVVLDASDEETEQKSGPAARPLLENFVNSSATVTDSNNQVSLSCLVLEWPDCASLLTQTLLLMPSGYNHSAVHSADIHYGYDLVTLYVVVAF